MVQYGGGFLILAAGACPCRSFRVASAPNSWNCKWLEERSIEAIDVLPAVLAHGAVGLSAGREPWRVAGDNRWKFPRKWSSLAERITVPGFASLLEKSGGLTGGRIGARGARPPKFAKWMWLTGRGEGASQSLCADK